MIVAQPTALGRITTREVHGSFIDETIGILANAPASTISFAVGAPAPEALGLVGIAGLVERVLARDGHHALGYGVTEGDGELREIIAVSARARGARVSAEDVIVTAGALQAIDLACRVFIRPGDLVVVESPAFANALSALRNHGARILEVPIDDDGLDVREAERLIRAAGARPRLFFVVPNFQNPTGATLSYERREQLLALAAGYGALVLDDDPYGALRFRGETIPDLATLAVNTGIVSVGTFSKTFLPGLRLGWAIADRATVSRMAAAKQTMDSCTSTFSQRLAVEFHRDPVQTHVDALRALYAEKQARARSALARAFDGTAVHWNDPEGGFYLWVTLPEGVSARRLLDLALEEGVAFVPGDAFAVTRDHSSALRFSYSWPQPERIAEGVCRLRRAYDRVLAS
ncbi:MAG TPA: PLP-dependent aminotransferase family protein [Candidatus Limnocylindria bacterium]|nr:PLP-dependent aminotransferase family protein [Candidatus Limnocylindria bacterium]